MMAVGDYGKFVLSSLVMRSLGKRKRTFGLEIQSSHIRLRRCSALFKNFGDWQKLRNEACDTSLFSSCSLSAETRINRVSM